MRSKNLFTGKNPNFQRVFKIEIIGAHGSKPWKHNMIFRATDKLTYGYKTFRNYFS